MRAKKSLGQHFLRSEKALRSIVEAGKLSKDDTVLEIGPGEGVLTEKLLETQCSVLAVEKDDALHELLKIKFQNELSSGQLNLVHGDIMDFEPQRYQLQAASYKLIANIPYNITGGIFRKFLSDSVYPERMVLLVQKEVAERIVAKKGKPLDSAQGKESILSISIKAYGKPYYVETVKAGSFAPAPRVDSAILVIEDISKNFFEKLAQSNNLVTKLLSEREEAFFEIVRAGFKSKRKKLSSNLSTVFPKEVVHKAFHELNLSDNTRAEDISIDEWGRIAVYFSV